MLCWEWSFLPKKWGSISRVSLISLKWTSKLFSWELSNNHPLPLATPHTLESGSPVFCHPELSVCQNFCSFQHSDDQDLRPGPWGARKIPSTLQFLSVIKSRSVSRSCYPGTGSLVYCDSRVTTGSSYSGSPCRINVKNSDQLIWLVIATKDITDL